MLALFNSPRLNAFSNWLSVCQTISLLGCLASNGLGQWMELSFKCPMAPLPTPEAYYCAKSKNNAQRAARRTQVGNPVANLFITDWEARIIFMDYGRPGSKHDLTHLRIPRAVPLIPSLPIFQVVVIITFKGAVLHVLVV